MNRGYVKLWRKSLDKGWIKNHKLWAFWSWCLLMTTSREFDAIVGLQVIHLMPGQFIFGRKMAADETRLTEREIRTILEFLKKNGNLTIKTTNKFSVITITNWGTYQSRTDKNDQQNDHQMSNKGPHTRTKEHKNIKPPEGILAEISILQERYSDRDLINQCFTAISSTRNSNRISNSVKLSILQAWANYSIESIIKGINTYLDKEYYQQGKNEKYLLGIIRNNKGTECTDVKKDQTRKSTGSHALDEYYRSQGVKVI